MSDYEADYFATIDCRCGEPLGMILHHAPWRGGGSTFTLDPAALGHSACYED